VKRKAISSHVLFYHAFICVTSHQVMDRGSDYRITAVHYFSDPGDTFDSIIGSNVRSGEVELHRAPERIIKWIRKRYQMCIIWNSQLDHHHHIKPRLVN